MVNPHLFASYAPAGGFVPAGTWASGRGPTATLSGLPNGKVLSLAQRKYPKKTSPVSVRKPQARKIAWPGRLERIYSLRSPFGPPYKTGVPPVGRSCALAFRDIHVAQPYAISLAWRTDNGGKIKIKKPKPRSMSFACKAGSYKHFFSPSPLVGEGVGRGRFSAIGLCPDGGIRTGLRGKDAERGGTSWMTVAADPL